MPTATSTCITNACVSAFSFEGADVRVLNRSDEPWWVLADVCKVLEIRNSPDAANRLDEDERSTIAITDSGNLNAERTIINESGLYSLILTSRKPAAKRFKKWVTAEVLPAIRKTGSYNVATRPRRPSVLRAFNTAMKIGERIGLESGQLAFHAAQYCKAKCGENPLELMGVRAFQAPVKDHTLTPSQIGQELGGISARRVNEILLEKGFQTYTQDSRGHRTYHLTELGKHYGRLEDTARAHTDGAVTVLRWYPTVVGSLRIIPKLEHSPRGEAV